MARRKNNVIEFPLPYSDPLTRTRKGRIILNYGYNNRDVVEFKGTIIAAEASYLLLRLQKAILEELD